MLFAGSKGKQRRSRTKGTTSLDTFLNCFWLKHYELPLTEHIKLIFLFSQGEAGRDGLSLPGPPGPPGPPGQIFNLQDVSIQPHFFFFFAARLLFDGKLGSSCPCISSCSSCLTTQMVPSISQGYMTLRVSLWVSDEEKKNNLSRISNDVKMTALQSLMAASCQDVSPWEIHDTNSYACLLHICIELE